MARLRLELLNDEADFLTLRGEWDALVDSSRAPNLFLTWEWVSAWRRHLAGRERLHVLLVRAGRDLVGIAPFVLMPRRIAACQWLPSLRLMGSGDVGGDYLDLIVRRGFEAETADLVASHISQQSFVLDARRVAPQSEVATVTAALDTRGWIGATRTDETCPFIPLAGRTWDRYLGSLGPQHRYNFRRRLRHLEERHGFRFERVSTEAERPTGLETLFRLHWDRWRERSTAFYSPQLRAFHHDVTARSLERGWLRLFVLSVDDEPAAALYGFAFGRKFYFYQAGFNPKFGSLSVGLVCMGLAIREAFLEGLDEYDLLHGDEPYKFLWAKEARPLLHVELYPPAMTAALCRAATHGYRKTRRIVRRVVSTARSFVASPEKVDRVRQSAVFTSAR
jgi:CelD/BcsL family acetyltransferase involved in cellulose biosynthesis